MMGSTSRQWASWAMLPLGALALVVAPVASAAPIVVAPASDVDALVESITGPGIEVVSSTLMVGSAATTGTFVGDGSDVDQEAALPFDSGVILGTGLVEGILGPNEGFYNGDGSGLDIDPEAGETCAVGAIPEGKEGVCDFDDGSGEGIFDATWLEIVFLPNQNELNLSYVFASDEYEEGAQARAGDALRILVNGERCALTPSGSAVGSHTIHIGTPELFVDNTTSAYAIEANGLSTGLECEASVTPGVENTLKIGIANIGDRFRDSWVILERAGLTASIPIVDLMSDEDGDGIPDAYDNCASIANVDQADLDGNDVGDLCETHILGVGGGACSGGDADSSPLGWAIIALLGWLLARRRSSRATARALVLTLLAGTLLWPGAPDALAEEPVPNLDTQLFRPSPFAQDLFSAPRRAEQGADHWNIGLMFQRQSGLLSIRRPTEGGGLLPLEDSTELMPLIEDDTGMNLLMSYAILEGFSLGVDLPFILSRTGAYSEDLPILTGSSLGDMRLLSRIQFGGRSGDGLSMGMNLGGITPTHNGAFRGRSGFGFISDLFLELRRRRWGMTFRAGAIWATEKERFLDVEQEHQAQAEIGAWHNTIPGALELIAELHGTSELNDRFLEGAVTPIELRAGARWRSPWGLIVGAGLGAGLTRGVGAPDYRALVSLSYESWYVLSSAQLDGAGGRDLCPTEEEDKDGYRDDDGCPDPDVERMLDVIVDRAVPAGTFEKFASAKARADARLRRSKSINALSGLGVPQVIVRSEASDEVESADEGETSRMFGAKSRRKRKLRKAPAGNRAPMIGAVQVSPESPVTGQAIQCTYTDFRDPDGDPDDSLVDWTVNGKDAGFGPTLEEGFVKGDKVRCTVTPHDGAVGGPKKYAQVIVRNTNPTIRSAKITPEAPKGGDTLQCVYDDFADPDGDPDRSSIVWTVNGLRAGGGRVLKTKPESGDRIACTVTPRDGEGSGDPVRAAVAVGNRPPSITSVWLEPKQTSAGKPITCKYGGYSDPDFHSDASKITWTVNGQPAGTGPKIEKGFVGGDRLQCIVTPNDGEVDGEPMRAETVIDNTPPVVDMVAIRPGKARFGDLLQCIYTGFSDLDGDRDASKVRWGVNGKVVGEGKVLNAKIRAGDVVTCIVEPHDGKQAGKEVRSELTVENTPPKVASVALYPEQVKAGDKVSCTYEGYTDVDGDTDASRIQWKVNGNLAGWNRVLTTDLKRGDVLRCEVEPFDGKTAGKTARSESIQVSNTPPSLKAVRIVPLKPQLPNDNPERKHLKCVTKGFKDADGDADAGSRITWEVNNEPAGSGAALTRELKADDWVRCKVRPYDGYDFGNEINAYARADAAWKMSR